MEPRDSLYIKTLAPFLLFERIVTKEREFFVFSSPVKEAEMNIFGVSLGGMGPHSRQGGEEQLSSLLYGPGSSIEERCPVKALVAGASPVQDP